MYVGFKNIFQIKCLKYSAVSKKFRLDRVLVKLALVYFAVIKRDNQFNSDIIYEKIQKVINIYKIFYQILTLTQNSRYYSRC